MKRLFSLALGLCFAVVSAHAEEGWTSLFNGKDLDGWTPKITGYDLGQDPNHTFRVEDGVLKVAYDKYLEFGGQFGHLFYKSPFTNYLFRAEYRFTGDQIKGGPGWAFRNSGVMILGQAPETIRKGQDFPVSIEVQLLGGSGKGERTTGNVCTPGTYMTMDGKLTRQHCVNSTSKTFHGDQWVTAEIEVRGGAVTHRINGEEVLKYTDCALDETDADAKKLMADGAPQALRGGSISLQSESHPVEFRNIQIKVLAD